jgi:hypothetical protein
MATIGRHPGKPQHPETMRPPHDNLSLSGKSTETGRNYRLNKWAIYLFQMST